MAARERQALACSCAVEWLGFSQLHFFSPVSASITGLLWMSLCHTTMRASFTNQPKNLLMVSGSATSSLRSTSLVQVLWCRYPGFPYSALSAHWATRL